MGTVARATSWCMANRLCSGFTARGVAPASCTANNSVVVQVYFKDATLTSNTDKNWTMWLVDKPRLQIFAKPMASGQRAVALLNRGSSSINATVAWATVAVGGKIWTKAHVRDLW